jgi:predicted transcriptional regulator
MMTLKEIVGGLGLSVRCGQEHLEHQVTGGYCGDLMSDVIANAAPGMLWITMQVHVNIIAVALLKEIAGIILVRGREPAPDTLVKAAEERIPVLVTELPAFEIAGKLHALLSGGS